MKKHILFVGSKIDLTSTNSSDCIETVLASGMVKEIGRN